LYGALVVTLAMLLRLINRRFIIIIIIIIIIIYYKIGPTKIECILIFHTVTTQFLQIHNATYIRITVSTGKR